MLAITRSTLIAVLAAFVIAAPAAATQPPVRSGYEYAVAASEHAGVPTASTAPSNSAFQWDDAGIGALATLGVVAVAAAAIAGARRNQTT